MTGRAMAIIALTTDFGARDTYVAEMKAAILGITRAVHLVDVTHEIARHDVLEGAIALQAAAAAFPRGTVHLAVVDPGVGTSRRGLVVAARGQLFVGPDNGLFTGVLEGASWRAFELTATAYRRARPSRTFHGRDIFAPAAAHLARGVAPARFGPVVADPVRLAWDRPRSGPRGVIGRVVHVDRFGNLVTSIGAAHVTEMGETAVVRVGGRTLPLVGTYGELPPGGAGGLLGSSARLEVAVRDGSAAAHFRARRGTAVWLGARGRGAGKRAATAAPGQPERPGVWGAPGAPQKVSPTTRSSTALPSRARAPRSRSTPRC